VRAAALVLVVLAATIGCGAKKGSDDAPAASASAPAAAAARRPSRHYFLARNDDRCEVYSSDGENVSEPLKTPCPLDIEPGERFRIAGRTCIRESTDPAREVPVVCPDPLTNLEKKDHKAAAAAASASAASTAPSDH
jgi:hypothetical protein